MEKRTVLIVLLISYFDSQLMFSMKKEESMSEDIVWIYIEESGKSSSEGSNEGEDVHSESESSESEPEGLGDFLRGYPIWLRNCFIYNPQYARGVILNAAEKSLFDIVVYLLQDCKIQNMLRNNHMLADLFDNIQRIYRKHQIKEWVICYYCFQMALICKLPSAFLSSLGLLEKLKTDEDKDFTQKVWGDFLKLIIQDDDILNFLRFDIWSQKEVPFNLLYDDYITVVKFAVLNHKDEIFDFLIEKLGNTFNMSNVLTDLTSIEAPQNYLDKVNQYTSWYLPYVTSLTRMFS